MKYVLVAAIDPEKDRKLSRILSAITLVLAVLMVVCAQFFVPLSDFFNLRQPLKLVLRFVVLALVLAFYFFLREAIRALLLKRFTGKSELRLRGGMPEASSPGLLTLLQYVLLTFLPVLGIGLLLLPPMLLSSYFWLFYFAEVTNIACLVFDVYPLIRLTREEQEVRLQQKDGAVNIFIPEE